MQDTEYTENTHEVHENEDLHFQEQTITTNQKIAIAGLGLFAFTTIIMYGVYLQHSIANPFAVNQLEEETTVNESTDGLCTGGNCQQADTEASLRLKDTDGDGLSDWDELNVYLTSPYIEDSDSDGFSDKKEIDTENDPNCPTGKNCYGVSEKNEDSQNEASVESNFIISTPQNSDSGNVPEFSGDASYEDILSGNVDVNTVKQLLIESGIDESLIKDLSDDEIMEIYSSVLSNL